MYNIYRKDHYKICFLGGLFDCIVLGYLLYDLIFVRHKETAFGIEGFLFFIAYTLYFMIKYFRKSLNFLVLRIDDNGIYICPEKDEGVFIPWDNIKHVIFVVDYYGSKMIVRQHNKETHYLRLEDYFHSFRPRKLINAMREYADNKEKVREVKDSLAFQYNDIIKRISKTEVKRE